MEGKGRRDPSTMRLTQAPCWCQKKDVFSSYPTIRGEYKKSKLVLGYEFRLVHVLGLSYLGDTRGLSYLGDTRGEASQLTVEYIGLSSREK